MHLQKICIFAAILFSLQSINTMAEPLSQVLFERSPAELRAELQEETGRLMALRRWIIVLAVTAMAIMAVISMFQMGIIEHLPDPPGRFFNSDKVNSSDQAYRFGVPDGTLVVASLAITILLAAFGSAARAETQNWLPLLLTAKAAVDAAFAGIYFWNMVAVQKVACIYCVAGGLLIVAIFLLTLPESWRAIQA